MEMIILSDCTSRIGSLARQLINGFECNVTGAKLRTPSSSNNLTVQVTYENAEATALYSASELDLETVGCFLEFQIGDFPSNKTYPVTDLLESGQDAQSES
ncbi:hypothetical protein AgCh_040183 [Apium graveolens]